MDSDEAGGYTVASEQFVNRLIKAVDDLVFIRGLATTQTVTSAHSLGAPSLDADPADADWTAEILTGSEDSTMDFGKRNMEPHPLAKLIKVSRKLIRASTLGIEALVIQRLSYKFAITQEKGFMTGTGANQPLGLFTASSDGITTGRDVSTGNTTGAFTFDGLIEAKYNQKSNYWPRMRWIFHRDSVKMAAKLKDGEGQYQWQPSTQAGQADRLLGFPFLMSEYAPNTFTTGLYVGIIGDFSLYWIVDALSMEVQRLEELYAATAQIGFIGRLETDGAPVLEEAFTRVTLA
jgi:HK97 family phage major capsid protein